MKLFTAKKIKKARPIEKDMNLGKMARQYPEVAEFVQEAYGLHCIGCGANVFDTVEAGFRVHGYTDEEIVIIIDEMNSLVQNEK